MHDLYHGDTYTWARRQAEALERRDQEAIDWPNVIEIIRDVADQQEDQLQAHYGFIQEMFLDLQYGIDGRPVPDIKLGIGRARHDINMALHSSPGLSERREELFAQAWASMRADAFVEFPEHGWDQVVPRDNPYTLSQVEDFNWWPRRRS